MKQKRIASKGCCYKGFKIEEKLHSNLVHRSKLLGPSIEWIVDEAIREFNINHAHELKGRKKNEKIVYKYRTLKLKTEFHQIFKLRRMLLGQIVDWQMNEVIREYENNHSKELKEKEKTVKKEMKKVEKEITEMDIEIETGSETIIQKKGNGRKKEEAREAENDNPNEEQENKQGDTLSIPTIPAE